ncbi:uncharacterized protein B0T23DRAFT_377813 [Neurospora hispaniola]|uniref:Secreted protein n=1 Tax=Neurospora hispaniola TaxID=588809 RepID=A0AAJ0MSN8_9PEZI|nr:hypothetical protein B0T23DRAFT_377813 [Neurospora hispaniola]
MPIDAQSLPSISMLVSDIGSRTVNHLLLLLLLLIIKGACCGRRPDFSRSHSFPRREVRHIHRTIGTDQPRHQRAIGNRVAKEKQVVAYQSGHGKSRSSAHCMYLMHTLFRMLQTVTLLSLAPIVRNANCKFDISTVAIQVLRAGSY